MADFVSTSTPPLIPGDAMLGVSQFVANSPGAGVTMIGNSTDNLSFFGVNPVVKQGTSGTSVVASVNSGGTFGIDATFDGYTIGSVVKALKKYGLLQ